MICQLPPLKSKAKPASSKQPFWKNTPNVNSEELFWSPITAGPYIVPITRWVE